MPSSSHTQFVVSNIVSCVCVYVFAQIFCYHFTNGISGFQKRFIHFYLAFAISSSFDAHSTKNETIAYKLPEDEYNIKYCTALSCNFSFCDVCQLCIPYMHVISWSAHIITQRQKIVQHSHLSSQLIFLSLSLFFGCATAHLAQHK